MKKSTLIMMVSIVLAIALGVGGTLAYLTSTDEDVNVMTLGNVSIAQLEYERVTDEDGNWIATGKTDKYGYTPDEIKDFTQAKPLYPAYFADGKIKWDDRNGSEAASGEGSHQQSWGQVKGEKATGAPGSNQLFDDSVYGVQDKFVFVENTGTSDAYVRTWFAFELGSVEADRFTEVIEMNCDTNKDENGNPKPGHWEWEWQEGPVEIDGNNYMVVCATYLGSTSNPTGILAPGTISYPSLLQVYMKPTATNEDVVAIDGNGNGMYDILVKSQATQTTNFPDAKTALEASFGEAAAPASLPWEEVAIPNLIYNNWDLYDAAQAGGSYIVVEDFDVTATYPALNGTQFTVDLNGHDLNSENYPYIFYSLYDSDYTVVGEGDSKVTGFSVPMWVSDNATMTIRGGTYEMGNLSDASIKGHCFVQNGGRLIIEDGVFTTADPDTALLYTINGTIEVKGGFFENTSGSGYDLLLVGNNPQYLSGERNEIHITGGTFVNWNPLDSAFAREWDNNGVVYKPCIIVMDGYTVVSETQANGDVWYTVVPE